MPRLTYQPEGLDPKSWDFTFGRITLGEMKSIQHLTQLAWDQVKEQFYVNNVEVIHAFIYTFLKRERPTLKPNEVQFCEDEYNLGLTRPEAEEAATEFTDDEVKAVLAEADANPEKVTHDTDHLLLDIFRERLSASGAEVDDADGEGEDEAPKA